MTDKTPRQLFKIFTHLPANRKMTAIVFLGLAIYAGAVCFASYYFLDSILKSVAGTMGEDIYVNFKQTLTYFLGLLISTSVMYILIAATFTMYHVNNMVGSVYSMERQINKAIQNEDFSEKVQLRKNDYFKELALSINSLMERVKK